MIIVRDKIACNELKKMSEKMEKGLVKAVVDVANEIMVVDAPMHVDEEDLLLEEGSLQENLWGINIYPHNDPSDWIEFDSMINMRPSMGNRSRYVENEPLRKKIISIVNRLITHD